MATTSTNVEDSGTHPYVPRVKSVVEDSSYSLAFLADMMGRFGLSDRWAYVDGVTSMHHGLSRERLAGLYREADAVFNVCGATRLTGEHMRCTVRVYLETDPVFFHGRSCSFSRRRVHYSSRSFTTNRFAKLRIKWAEERKRMAKAKIAHAKAKKKPPLKKPPLRAR